MSGQVGPPRKGLQHRTLGVGGGARRPAALALPRADRATAAEPAL
jgi:hypothetical protein